MKNKGFIITIIILVILILLFLFWHPFDYLKTTINTEAKSDSTIIVTPPANQQPSQTTIPPKNKQQTSPTTGSVSKVIVIIRDETTKQTKSETKEQVAKITEYTAPKNTPSSNLDVRTSGKKIEKPEIIIFKFNHDDGNHYPELRYDDLDRNDQVFMSEFPEAVLNPTGDGHNLKLLPTNSVTGNYGITTDGLLYLKAAPAARWITSGVVEVKGSITNWNFKQMSLETINGAEYYTCKIK